MSGDVRDDIMARITLNRIFEPGNIRGAKLIEAMGPVDALDFITSGDGDTAARAAQIEPERLLEDAAAAGIRFVVPGDPEWPNWVGNLTGVEHSAQGGAPVGLWVRGDGSLSRLTDFSVAIVGSRAATTYGVSVASDLAYGVTERGYCVVSGGAFGIDQAAHRGALSSRSDDKVRSTVVVLACGVDRAYPSAHATLFDGVLRDGGLLVSEVPPGSAPTKSRFLARNRLIAALSLGTVVVEAARRSGALNAAAWTKKLDRPLMAVPGPVTSATSQGVHDLISDGGAHLVTNAEELIAALG